MSSSDQQRDLTVGNTYLLDNKDNNKHNNEDNNNDNKRHELLAYG